MTQIKEDYEIQLYTEINILEKDNEFLRRIITQLLELLE